MNIKFILLILLIILPQFIFCQGEGLPSNEVEVIKAFEANLEEASKIHITPKLSKIDPVKKIYDYKITILPLDIKYPDPVIKPLAIATASAFESHNFFAKLGYGTLKSPYAKIVYGNRDNFRYDLNVDASHYSIDNDNKIENQRMSNSKLDINGKYRIKENIQLLGGISGQLQRRGNYFTFNDFPSSENRKINQFDIHAGIQNVEETQTGINYYSQLKASRFSISDSGVKATENDLTFNGDVDKKITDKLIVALMVEARYSRYSESSGNDDLLNSLSSLEVRYHQGRFAANAGVSVITDPFHKVSLFPKGEIAFGLVGHQLQVFGGADQGYILNGIHQYGNEIPFINTSFSDLRNVLWQSIHGGIRGEWTFISYQGKAGLKNIKSQAYFTNTEDLAHPTMHFDDVKAIFASGNVEFAFSDDIVLGATMTKNFYDTETVDELYGIPSLDFDGYGKISLLDNRLAVKGSIHLADQTNALIRVNGNNNEVVTLNNQLELNAGLEFWPLQKVGIYAQAANILDNRYSRWYGYPTVGINFNGGILIKF